MVSQASSPYLRGVAEKNNLKSLERRDGSNNSRHFMFQESNLFNPENNPLSPNRPVLISSFLKQKVGEEKFEKVLAILSASETPLKLLEGED